MVACGLGQRAKGRVGLGTESESLGKIRMMTGGLGVWSKRQKGLDPIHAGIYNGSNMVPFWRTSYANESLHQKGAG
jgi:hypothetical protein